MSEMDYQDILDMTASRADLLSRCILYGVVQPGGDLTPEVALAVSESLRENLPTLSESNALAVYDRALEWAVGVVSFLPEAGLLVGLAVLARVDGTAVTPSIERFKSAYAPILSEVMP